MKQLQLGVFASGRGSNFQSILNHTTDGTLHAEIRLLLTNNPEAGALELARASAIPDLVIRKDDFPSRDVFVETMIEKLAQHGVEWIALAGYMKKIPQEVVKVYRNRIVNIHPALLPSFGGKGLYGHHVHQAVLDYGCKVTGVTVHLVDEAYDHGPIIAQRPVPVEDSDTPDTLAARVLQVEHALYPEVLEIIAQGRLAIQGNKASILPHSMH